MSTNKLAEVLGNAAKRMRADFMASQAYSHRAEAGKSREAILCDIIGPRVPGHVKVAHSAEIATAAGDVSGQCDVVLFDRSTPPILDTETYRIIPNECVYGVIEVKSSLDKTQLLDACESIRQVKGMPKTAYHPVGIYHQYSAHGKKYDHLPTLGLIFAFGGSDIATLGQHFWEWCNDREPWERPDGVYVLGGGFLAWTDPDDDGTYDLYPQSSAGLAVVRPSPEGDVLFNFVLRINTNLAQAGMWPLRLNDYAASAPHGVTDSVLKPKA